MISTEDSGVVHGIFVLDWDGDGRDAILTASFNGIHLLRFGKDGRWSRTEIAKGDPAPWPKSGSSDIAVGRLGKSRFLAAIEPWHGNQVAVYRQQGGRWERQVIDTTLVDGHTIAVADLNHDGSDEIIAGYRGPGPQRVPLLSGCGKKPFSGNSERRINNLQTGFGQKPPFSAACYADDAAGDHWTRQILDDGGMGAAACAVADLSADGRPDIVCIGSATTNLKWYENLGSDVPKGAKQGL